MADSSDILTSSLSGGGAGGGGIAELLEDTSPQLGGNLDANGNTIDGRTVADDGSKLDTIEASADVTDEANVKSALDGATITSATVATGDKVLIQDVDDTDNLKTVTAQSIADLAGGIADLVDDTTPQLGGDLDLNGNNIDFPSTPNISDCLDEDDMLSDSATALATQQSIKKYVDDNAGGGGAWIPATSGSLSTASELDVTGITGATKIVLYNFGGSTGGADVLGRLSSNNGSSWLTGYSDCTIVNSISSTSPGGGGFGTRTDDFEFGMKIGVAGGVYGGNYIEIIVASPEEVALYTQVNARYTSHNTDDFQQGISGARRNTAEVNNALRISLSVGTMTGDYIIYTQGS